MLAKGSGLGSKRLGLLRAALKQLGTGTGNAGHIHVTHMRHQVARQLKQVIALLDLRTNQSIELGNIAIGNGAGKLAQDLVRLVKERTGRDPLSKLGWTDVARFSQLGIPAVNLGTGDPLLAHKHDEQVPESDLTAMAAILTDWLV